MDLSYKLMTGDSVILKAQSATLRLKVESFFKRIAFFISVLRFDLNASRLIDSCFLWRGHGSIPMPRFYLLAKSAQRADRSNSTELDRVYRGSPNMCFIGTNQAIRSACPANFLMAIRECGRSRKYTRKGGRRLGTYMTERKV